MIMNSDTENYFSQNDEQKLIEKYFSEPGILFDIGASDGITFSNSRKMLLSGWNGFLVEPGKKSYNKLYNLYKDNTKVKTYNYGIGNLKETKTFYEPLTFPFNVRDGVSFYSDVTDRDNCGINGTFKIEYRDFFESEGVDYSTSYDVDILTFNDFHEMTGNSKCDLLLIDTSGSYDYEILKQIDLNNLGVRMFITAWSWEDIANYDDQDKFVELAERQGFKMIDSNDDNLIFLKL